MRNAAPALRVKRRAKMFTKLLPCAMQSRPYGVWRDLFYGRNLVVAQAARFAQVYGDATDADRIRPYRFADRDAADAFVRELVASFSYLGCRVSAA